MCLLQHNTMGAVLPWCGQRQLRGHLTCRMRSVAEVSLPLVAHPNTAA